MSRERSGKKQKTQSEHALKKIGAKGTPPSELTLTLGDLPNQLSLSKNLPLHLQEQHQRGQVQGGRSLPRTRA